jgi:hypothetical protein
MYGHTYNPKKPEPVFSGRQTLDKKTPKDFHEENRSMMNHKVEV